MFKKLILILICALSFLHARFYSSLDIAYANRVATVFIKKDDKYKAIGEIYPFAKVDIISEDERFYRVELVGWIETDNLAVIYKFPDTNRLYMMLKGNFSKTLWEDVKKMKEDEFKKIDLKFYIKKGDVEKSFISLNNEYRKAFEDICSRCHKLYKPDSYSINRWSIIMRYRKEHVALSPEEKEKAKYYIDLHSKNNTIH